MKERGIAVSQVHARNDSHTTFLPYQTSLRNVDAFSKSMICIPVGGWGGERERSYIVDSIKKFSMFYEKLDLPVSPEFHPQHARENQNFLQFVKSWVSFIGL